MDWRSIKRSAQKITIALPLTLLAAPPLPAVDPGLLQLTRSDVNFMMGVRVSDVANSPLVRTMIDEAIDSKPEWGAIRAIAGANPLEGFDEILLAANLDPQSPQEPKDALVVLRGSFGAGRLDQIFCSAGCEREQYRKLGLIKVERKDADTPGYLAVLDSQYAVLGERPAVRAAIDRHLNQQTATMSPAMQGWIDRMGRYQVWFVAKGPFKTSKEVEAGPAMMAADAASKMEGFGLGLLLDKDVSLAIEVESINDQEAKKLFEMAQGMLAMSRMGSQQQAKGETAKTPGVQLLENLKLANTGKIVSASLTIPQKQLTQQLRAKLEERHAQTEPTLEAGLKPPPPDEEPTPRHSSGAIRVYGLDPRPVEFPVTQK